MNPPAVVDPSLAALYQLFSAATRQASASMARWTSGDVSLTLDRVVEVPYEEVANEFEVANEYVTMIVFTLTGEYGGYFILTFDEENGRSLAASLTQNEINKDPEWTELEKSALSETGNILSGAYFNEITRILDIELVPSTPFFMQDFGGSVLQQAIMPQAMVREQVLICETRFEKGRQRLNWNVLFVPDGCLHDKMATTLESSD